MTRIGTGFCVAAMLGCMATVGAQTSTSTDQQRSSATAQSGDISVTGCLAKAADGSYTLTNAKMDNQASSTTASGSGSTTTASSGTTAGTSGSSTTTASGTTGTASSSPSASSAMNSASTWVLSGGSDLDKHVGHKVQVTGRSAATSSASAGATGSTTAATSGTTAGSTAGTATGTTGATSPSGTSSSASQHRLDVESVKMISSSCS